MAMITLDYREDDFAEVSIHNVPAAEIPPGFVRPEGFEGYSLVIGTIRITIFPEV